MNKKIAAAVLSWVLALTPLAPCAPVFAAQFQIRPVRIAPVARLAPVPRLPVLPTSLVPAGIAAGAVESGLRQSPAPAAIAAPAAAPAPVEAAAAPTPTLLARLTTALAAKLPWHRVFDSSSRGSAPVSVMGIQPLPSPVLPQGVDIDMGPAPTTPLPATVGGIELNAFDVPGARPAPGIFDSGPRLLQADGNSEADIERALREMVDTDAARFGVASNELQTVHVRRVAGRGDQADSIFAYFRQQRQSANPDGSVQAVDIQGSYLSFTIKVLNGKATVMAAMAKIYPHIAVQTKATLSDADLKTRAEAKLPQGQGIELALFARKIIFHKGVWKTVNLYHIDGLPQAVGIMVAVDVATGEVFGWDARLGAEVTGTAAARGENDDRRPNGKATLTEQVMPWLNVSIAGKAGQTDVNGKFSGEGDSSGTEFTASLSGQWVQVNDRNRKPVKVSATLTPGQEAKVVFNPTQSDEYTVSQVNTYLAVTRIHDWWSQRLGNDKRIDRAIPANVNIDDECNAYYTPGRPTINFFKSSPNCSDTARPGIVAHEYGHFIVDMIVPATTGGLHEGWGDIGSMFLLGTPIIGEGFLKGRKPSHIRDGENKYQYRARDEVHDQGQAWMGFAWKLRKMLIAALGEAAGAAEAEALIVPTLFAGATEIPAAMSQVLLNALDKQGNVRFEKEIRAAAKAHGIDLPKNPGVFASLWNWVMRGLFVRSAGNAA